MKCNHRHAKCVETTEPKEEGRFAERYKCDCGARGTICGREEEPPTEWERTGPVFD